MEISEKARSRYIDIAKGLGILLVLLGHLLPNDVQLKSVIYSFHMPLFFIVSGIVVKDYSFKERLRRRTQTILIPYILWALIFSSFSFKNLAFILYGTNETLAKAGSNGMLWFMVSMYFASILGGQLVSILTKAKHKNILLLISSIAILFISWGVNFNHGLVKWGIGLPWALDVTLLATAFVIFGALISTTLLQYTKRLPLTVNFIIGIVMLFVSYAGVFEHNERGYSQMATYDIGNPAMFFVVGCIASVGLILLSRVLENLQLYRMLSWLGKNSLLIFIMHRTLVYYCKDFYIARSNVFILIAMWAALTVYSGIAAILIKRFCPFLAGKADKNVSLIQSKI